MILFQFTLSIKLTIAEACASKSFVLFCRFFCTLLEEVKVFDLVQFFLRSSTSDLCGTIFGNIFLTSLSRVTLCAYVEDFQIGVRG